MDSPVPEKEPVRREEPATVEETPTQPSASVPHWQLAVDAIRDTDSPEAVALYIEKGFAPDTMEARERAAAYIVAARARARCIRFNAELVARQAEEAADLLERRYGAAPAGEGGTAGMGKRKGSERSQGAE